MLEEFITRNMPAPGRSQIVGVFGAIDRPRGGRSLVDTAHDRGLDVARLAQLTGLPAGRVSAALDGGADLEASGRVAACLDAVLPELGERPPLAAALTRARWRQQLAATHLAERLQVHRSTVASWEAGQASPRPVQCAAILQHLPVEPGPIAEHMQLAAWEINVIAGRQPEPPATPEMGRAGVGRLVRRQRLRLQMTVAQFAVAVRCSTSLVTSWEAGAYTPSAAAARRLSEVTAVPATMFRPPVNRCGRVPQLLRHRRAQLGLTQQHLADSLGVSAAAVTAWECGRSRPSPTRWSQIASVLGVAVATVRRAAETGTVASVQ